MWRMIGFAAMAAAGAGAAYAQVGGTSGARQGAGEDEIVVVATPFDSRSGEILQGAARIERAELVETLGSGLGETLDRTPGVSSTFFGAGASRPVIRGLGEDRIRILTNGLGQIDASAVSPDHGLTVEGLEAQAVEVLRGPAALAYGGNAVGGVVNVLDGRIRERAPEASEGPFSGQAVGGIASGLDRAEAAAALSYAGEKAALRIDGFVRDAGDYEIPGYAASPARRAADPDAEAARDTAPNSFSQAEAGAVSASAYGDWGFFGASLKRFEALYGIPEAGEEEGEPGSQEEPALYAGPRIDMEETRVELHAGLKAGFGPFEAPRLSLALVDYAHAELEPSGEIGTRFLSEGGELRLEIAQREWAGWRGLWGVSALSRDLSAIGEEAFLTPTETEEVALFGVQKRSFGRVTIEGGARYDRRTLDNAVSGERTFDLVSASLGLGWTPRPALFAGLTLARTERAPTDAELFSDGAHLATASYEIGDPGLGKETALTVEATLRWRAGPFDLEVNAFHAGFDDFVALLSEGVVEEESGLPLYVFTPADASLYGGEATAHAHLLDRDGYALTLDAGVDLVRGELDEGGALPRIPPRTWTLGAEGRLDRFAGRVEWVRTEEADHLAAFETPTEGSEVFNARASFRPVRGSDRLVFVLDGRNLSDEEVRVHTSFVKDLLPRPGRTVRFAISSAF